MGDSSHYNLIHAYLEAKQAVIKAGFSEEIAWQENINFDNVNESEFLSEAAWVILSSGMREKIVRKKFPDISTAFFNWESARTIVLYRESCFNGALRCFNHVNKINAILKIAFHIYEKGFHFVKESIVKNGIPYIMSFPYMGPATSYHFAKNNGLQCVKPDRHLIRIAKKIGYNSPESMCSEIAIEIGEKIAVVDIVLWRYATIFTDYLDSFYSKLPRNLT